MLDFQKRVVDERSELEDKRSKLAQFTITKAFDALNAIDQKLLLDQLSIMTQYVIILNARIGRFTATT